MTKIFTFSFDILSGHAKKFPTFKIQKISKFKKLSVKQLSSPYLFGNEGREEAIQHLKHGECQVGVHGGYNFLHVLAQELNGRLNDKFSKQ